MVDKWRKRWYVPSHSNPSRVYTVAQAYENWAPQQEWGCSCPAWKFKASHASAKGPKQPRPDCKHIKELKAALSIGEAHLYHRKNPADAKPGDAGYVHPNAIPPQPSANDSYIPTPVALPVPIQPALNMTPARRPTRSRAQFLEL